MIFSAVILLLAHLSYTFSASPSFAPSTFAPSTRSPTAAPSTRSPTAAPSTRSPTRSPTAVPTALPTHTPSAYPSYAPTPIPTPVVQVKSSVRPIALHQLVVVNTADSALIRLKSYDTLSDSMVYRITSLPSSGKLYQLSQVFSSYGYEPKAGSQIASTPTVVSGSNNRVYYTRPSPDAAGIDKWGTFTFIATDNSGINSYEGTVTLVSANGALIGSSFLLNDEGWTISGNKQTTTAVSFEPYSRGQLLNRYISGSDDKINLANSASARDDSLWYFEAPSKYLGNHGIAYGGTLQFTLSSFSGDFSKLNTHANLVELECAECTNGITLVFSLDDMLKSPNGAYNGGTKRFSIPLKEGSGWRRDPQNTLITSWTAASQCDMLQVLSRLSRIRILGDWTTWSETIALDDVSISNTKGQIPLCASTMPDASVCTC